jgi:hypothetical protein
VVLGLQLVNAFAAYYVAISSRHCTGLPPEVRIADPRAFSRSPTFAQVSRTRAPSCALDHPVPPDQGMAIEQMVGTLQAARYVVGFLVVLFTISVEVSLFRSGLPPRSSILYRLST